MLRTRCDAGIKLATVSLQGIHCCLSGKRKINQLPTVKVYSRAILTGTRLYPSSSPWAEGGPGPPGAAPPAAASSPMNKLEKQNGSRRETKAGSKPTRGPWVGGHCRAEGSVCALCPHVLFRDPFSALVLGGGDTATWSRDLPRHQRLREGNRSWSKNALATSLPGPGCCNSLMLILKKPKTTKSTPSFCLFFLTIWKPCRLCASEAATCPWPGAPLPAANPTSCFRDVRNSHRFGAKHQASRRGGMVSSWM